MKSSFSKIVRLSCTTILLWFSYLAVLAFYQVANGFGKFILPWKISFFAFTFFIVCTNLVSLLYLHKSLWIQPLSLLLISYRKKIRSIRWLLALLIIAFPITFLQYTHWGIQFTDGFLHVVFYLTSVIAVAFLITNQENNDLISFPAILAALLICGSTYPLAATFLGVTDYPLALSWSEGNRLYDYSILFGRAIYQYPAHKPLLANLDFGRQLLWGLPFLIPSIGIFEVRFWGALVSSLPYAILSFVLFYSPKIKPQIWLGLSLWGYVFLQQTAIYPTIILAAALVALAWQLQWKRSWFLVVIASFFAALSRSTWAVAPAIWSAACALIDTFSHNDSRNTHIGSFYLPFLLVAAGIMGGFLPFYTLFPLSSIIYNQTNYLFIWVTLIIILIIAYPIVNLIIKKGRMSLNRGSWFVLSLLAIVVFYWLGIPYIRSNLSMVYSQPLYWERLLPTTTNPNGLLMELCLAFFPLTIYLIIIIIKKDWKPNLYQTIVMLLPALIFIVIGLVASVKAGGGNNLHNFDLFFIWLLWLASFALRSISAETLLQKSNQSVLLKICAFSLVILPIINPLLAIQPLKLYPEEKISNVVARVRSEVDAAKQKGDILFMDQRQLLTFGYIKGVDLVHEYDKKYLMDKALERDEAYFDAFSTDLARHRFSLIITNPLRVQLTEEKDIDYGFGEENDLWVKWIAEPVLTYYEPLETYGKGRRVQILVPKSP